MIFTSGDTGEDGLPEIANSLRFNAANSTYASRTFGTPTNAIKWTVSAWVKRGALGSARPIFGHYTNVSIDMGVTFNANDQIQMYGSNTTACLVTSRLFRDPSAWFHLVVAYDTANTTTSNRVKIYIDGTECTYATDNRGSFGSTSSTWNMAALQYIGYYNSPSLYHDGYLANFTHIDGQALTPSSFAYTDPNGQWRSLSKAALTTLASSGGTNSFFLPFDNTTSTTTLGYDASSKGNNFTLTNMVRDGSVNDCSSLDTPTNNFATLNVLNKASNTVISNGALVSTNAASVIENTRATVPFATDLQYWEHKCITVGSSLRIDFGGILASYINSVSNTAYLGSGAPTGTFGATFNSGLTVYVNGSSVYTNGSANVVANDVVRFAHQASTGRLWVALNGTWFNSGNPAAGTGYVATTAADYVCPAQMVNGGGGTNSVELCLGQRPVNGGSFDSSYGGWSAFTVPSGFKALNRKNLPDPTGAAANPQQHYYVKTLNKSGDTSFTLPWDATAYDTLFEIKIRGTTGSWYQVDGLRGYNKILHSDTTAAETTDANVIGVSGTTITLKSSLPDGSYVVKCRKAGLASGRQTNTSGTVTSTVSANTQSGFSIALFDGPGTNASFGHGLSSALKMLVLKARNDGTRDWLVGHSGLTNWNYYLMLNSAGGQASQPLFFNGTAPTSTLAYIGGSGATNQAGMLAYCYAEVAGYSKAFSYGGNSSADGPNPNLGFLAADALLKRIDTTGNWCDHDSARPTYNGVSYELYSNLNYLEGTSNGPDKLSNSIKLRDTYSDVNASGGTYIGFATALQPFKFANAR